MQSLVPCDLSDKNINVFLKLAVQHFIRSETPAWEEIIGSWYSCDLYNALLSHVMYCKLCMRL
jgi:hypothetical protein